MKFLAAALPLIAVLCSVQVNAWGSDGHQITASIAQNFLTPNALALAKKLINANLSTVATWADQVKSSPAYKWSKELHYINTPNWECNFTYRTDCKNDRCVAGAIANYTKRIVSSFPAGQVEALKFLVHFVGDIHQPLHVGFYSDKGGNSEHGTFMKYSGVALHEVWDTSIIVYRLAQNFSYTQSRYTAYLMSRAKGDLAGKVKQWNTFSVGAQNLWGQESAAIACQYAYTDQTGAHIKNGFYLQAPYYQFVLETVEEQLIKGGVRLAALLNFIAAPPTFEMS